MARAPRTGAPEQVYKYFRPYFRHDVHLFPTFEIQKIRQMIWCRLLYYCPTQMFEKHDICVLVSMHHFL